MIRAAAAVFGLLLAAPAAAGTMPLAWDAVAGADHYRIYSGTTAGAYTRVSSTLDSTPSYMLAGLRDCVEHFVCIRTVDASGVESGACSEAVSGWPSIAVDYHLLARDAGTGQVRGLVFGQNLQPGANVHLTGAPAARNETVHGCTVLVFTLEEAPAAASWRVERVDNPDGTTWPNEVNP